MNTSDFFREIKQHVAHDKFVYPYYGRLSLLEIASTLKYLFDVPTNSPILPFDFPKTKPRNIITLIVDGLAYSHFNQHKNQIPCLRLFSSKAKYYPITSVFPSTTPAALTTIATGRSPQEHGLPEWTVYFEEVDAIIETLPFKTRDMRNQDELLSIGGSGEMLYEGGTVFQDLKNSGVKSFSLTSHKYSNSVYNQKTQKGSYVMPYFSHEDLFMTVSELLPSLSGKNHFYLYYGGIDYMAHHFGINSVQHTDEMKKFFESLQRNLIEKIDKKTASETMLLITADHGLSSIKGDDIINLNRYTLLEDNFKKGRNGKKILPTGSPHDVMLFIDPAMEGKILEFLKGELDRKAEVITTREAVSRGLFGLNQPSDRFLRRIGNILILPYPGYHVWYQFIPNAQYSFLGMHGGLSEDEMIVPFIFSTISDLLT
jgi:predicted AlkP superfamily pyrophosphatase or phosphodiesterase